MKTHQSILINYGELVLKGKNRKDFEVRLQKNIELAFSDPDFSIKRHFGRIELTAPQDKLLDKEFITSTLGSVFGIANYTFAYKIVGDYGAIEKTTLELISKESFNTFAIRAKRADKNFPMKSADIDRQLGAAVADTMNKKVDLTNPDLKVHIRITNQGNYIYFKTNPGAGGLPVGSSGKMLSLLSSGIDSPVASYRMMKRGATVQYIHFHSYPMTSRASIENTQDIIKLLHKHQPQTKLYLAPLAELQKKIVSDSPAKYRVVLYRRAMFQIASQIAKMNKAKALITGESLGQVASQTLQNMTTTSAGLPLPVFRPLIGMDKQEIIDQAAKINTYDISIRPYEDCCSLLMPKSVETHAKLADIKKIEAELPWQDLIQDVVKNTEVINF